MTAVLWLFRGDVSDLVAYTALFAAGCTVGRRIERWGAHMREKV